MSAQYCQPRTVSPVGVPSILVQACNRRKGQARNKIGKEDLDRPRRSESQSRKAGIQEGWLISPCMKGFQPRGQFLLIFILATWALDPVPSVPFSMGSQVGKHGLAVKALNPIFSGTLEITHPRSWVDIIQRIFIHTPLAHKCPHQGSMTWAKSQRFNYNCSKEWNCLYGRQKW